MDEQTLVASARPGGRATFDSLVNSYQNAAYNVAYRILGHPAWAAQATQEAFRTVRGALPASPGGPREVWLLRHLVQACRRCSRRHGGQARAELAIPTPAGARHPDAVDPGAPEAATVSPGLAEALQAGISSLPWDERVALVLSDVHGLSYDGIAEATGTSPAAVRRRLAQARCRLRDHLTDCPAW